MAAPLWNADDKRLHFTLEWSSDASVLASVTEQSSTTVYTLELPQSVVQDFLIAELRRSS